MSSIGCHVPGWDLEGVRKRFVMIRSPIRRSIAVSLFLFSAGFSGWSPGYAETPRISTSLEEFEAKFLILLAPHVRSAVERGASVGLVPELGDGWDQQSYYVYRVAVRTDSPSGLIGYYAVNRFTADVWDGQPAMIVAADLSSVQEIIRKVHGISEETIRQFRDRPVYRKK